MSGEIKIGVVGGGRWGINHIRTLHKMGRLGAILEADTKRSSALAAEFAGVPIYADIGAIDDPRIKGLVIATPVATHFELGRQALDAGFGILVEKPTTPRLEQTRALIESAEKKGLSFMTGFLLLYSPAIQKIRELLARDAVGHLLSFSFKRLNFGQARTFENAWWSLGVHDVAVLAYLKDSAPARIAYNGHSQLVGTGNVHDDAHVEVDFSDGAKAYFHCSWNWPFKQRELLIVGTKGSLFFDETKSELTWHKKHFDEVLKVDDSGVEIFKFTEAEPLALELEDFYQALSEKRPPRAGAGISRAVAEIFARTEA